MDLYCVRCGEPWNIDTFHEVAGEKGVSFPQVIADFRQNGCVATGWTPLCAPSRPLVAEASAAMFDLLGDDVDGIASMMEDFVNGY